MTNTQPTATRQECTWCGRTFTPGYRFSGWEQESRNGEYHKLCVRCANRRLNNPYNALLPMREVQDA